jgi:hypothetical protein
MMEEEYFPTTSARGGHSPNHLNSVSIASTDLAERTPLIVVPVPFVTPWFRDLFYEIAPPEHRPKRAKLEHEMQNPSNNGNDSSNQMECDGENEKHDEWWPANQMKSDPQQVPVLAKLYYEMYGQQPQEVKPTKLRLNEVVEMIGVLEHEDTNTSSGSNSAPSDFDVVMGASWEEDRPAVPSSIPRLHVVWYASVDMDLDATPSAPNPTENYNPLAPVQALAKALSISETPATAIWMTMVSMAERESLAESNTWAPVQTPNETTLGCASLGLVLPSQEACTAFASALYSVLSQVAPVVHFLDVTNDSLKDMRPPSKLHGRLTPTPLQLPKGATLIVNVSAVQPGRLSGEDVETMQALQQLTQGHKLPYRFDGGIKIPFEADLRVIVLSTNVSKKLLACTLQAECNYRAPAHPPSVAALPAVRDALTSVRGKGETHCPNCNIALSAKVLERAQQDFIERRATARNANRPAVTERDFHRWLTLTRLQARSRQGRTADVEDWNLALVLDDAMVASLESI